MMHNFNVFKITMHLNCSDFPVMNVAKNDSKQGVHCKTRDRPESGPSHYALQP